MNTVEPPNVDTLGGKSAHALITYFRGETIWTKESVMN